MANITYHQPADSAFFQGFSGTPTLVSASNTLIVTADGPYSAAISGIFSPTGSGIANSITYSYAGTPYVTFSGFNISATNTYAVNNLFRGDDRISGSLGNDTFYASLGNDDYNGGAGRDTIDYGVTKGNVTVVASGTGYLAKVAGKTDAMNSVERLAFTDGTLALDVKAGEATGSVYRLYQAALDRKPDTAGLKYWVDQVDQGTSVSAIALGFVQSNEFRQLNPAGDTPSLLKSYYQNVLHRAPDATGMAYWSSQAAGGLPAHEILVAFAESNENLGNTAAATKDGIWLG
ncbi:DUF4214 domain-containing protein [Pseudomonas syringae]|uniref:DUF4214 domain-containing protein n=1 Tax=Pseudomonas syringae TaxID=317 RepID=A0A085VNY0_PSESX|nr:DUF4214 domain-containing protein [Pseudomonas syringae]KFE57143.1 hypothetical protein IV01_05550 [Pseudomonas syringae]